MSDFLNYINAVSVIVLNSKPRFTVGIFGDWGIGKTTLLKNIKNKLEEKNANCVIFNAWRYEGVHPCNNSSNFNYTSEYL